MYICQKMSTIYGLFANFSYYSGHFEIILVPFAISQFFYLNLPVPRIISGAT